MEGIWDNTASRKDVYKFMEQWGIKKRFYMCKIMNFKCLDSAIGIWILIRGARSVNLIFLEIGFYMITGACQQFFIQFLFWSFNMVHLSTWYSCFLRSTPTPPPTQTTVLISSQGCVWEHLLLEYEFTDTNKQR